MNIKEAALDAIKKAEEAKIEKLKTELNIYFFNSSGIGEHSDILEEIEKKLEAIASAQDIIDTIDNHFKD